MLAAVEKYILQKEKGPVVTTVSTSLRFTDIAKEEEVDIYYTPVGSVDVGRKMVEVGAVYGGEGNGGIIYPRHQVCRDGAMAAALVLEMLAQTGMKASEIKRMVPTYFNNKTKILVAENLSDTMEKISSQISRDQKEINVSKIETIDGIKLWFPAGWLLIRPSGTEPMIRVVSEAKTPKTRKKIWKSAKNTFVFFQINFYLFLDFIFIYFSFYFILFYFILFFWIFLFF